MDQQVNDLVEKVWGKSVTRALLEPPLQRGVVGGIHVGLGR